jgi:hypothetical protein
MISRNVPMIIADSPILTFGGDLPMMLGNMLILSHSKPLFNVHMHVSPFYY